MITKYNSFVSCYLPKIKAFMPVFCLARITILIHFIFLPAQVENFQHGQRIWGFPIWQHNMIIICMELRKDDQTDFCRNSIDQF